MIKVFLVEDEYAIREGIKRSIHWERDGFELVGEAGDGEVALPKIIKSKPDILITDIRMPFMDGLELSRLVKSEMPDIKIIVLSGYDDFNYAKQAISIGVEEYILKPVSEETLMEELKKVAEIISKEKQENEAREKYVHDMEEIRILEQQKFLHDMIDGKLSIQESMALGKKLGIEVTAECYSILLMQVFSGNSGESDIDAYSGIKEDIYSRIKENCNDIPNVFLYDQVGDVLCFLIKADSEEELRDMIRRGTESIRKLMKDHMDMLYFMAVGKIVERIRDVNISYADASRKFAERYMIEESAIFDGTEKKDKKSGKADPVIEEKAATDKIDLNSIDAGKISQKTILHFLKNGTIAEVDDFTEEYFSSIGYEVMESMMLRQYVLVEALLSAAAFMKTVGVEGKELEEILGDTKDPTGYASSVDSAREYIQKLLNTILEYRNKLSDQKYIEIIDKAKEYIQNNYQNEDMSLQSVALEVNVSSNHFSAIFRKETGETFIDYLTEVRMEKARTLLVCTAMKTSEIGFQVGYRDPHYFSYIFKKTQGMSPKEYRKAKTDA
jgi:two-component system response regulator YesN